MITEMWSYSYWHTIVLIHTGQGLGRVVMVMSLLRPRTKFLGAKTSGSTDSPLEVSYLVNMYYSRADRANGNLTHGRLNVAETMTGLGHSRTQEDYSVK